MPMRTELPIRVTRERNGNSDFQHLCAWATAMIKNPELQMVAVFCGVGLWLTLYFMHRFPDYGEMIQAAVLFP